VNNKVAIAISMALASISLTAAAVNVSVVTPKKMPDQIQVIDSKKSTKIAPINNNAVFTPESNISTGKHRYFIRLNENPVALYQGGIEGFKATSPAAVKNGSRKLDVKSKNVQAYRNFLTSRQNDVLAKATRLISDLKVIQRTTLAYNGMVVEMTQDQAMKLALIPGIAHVQREVLSYPQTDSGPAFIKAPGIWDGSANGTASKGEDMVVGIIDTGINTDHPSFADVGGDGYDHTNPWGEGVYAGDCATDEWASLCNDKLIGVFSYPAITSQYPDYDPEIPLNGVDHNGHGSHTASTTAGNVILNKSVPNVDGEDSGVVFESMSGVAPHANIISYQVCLPGENDAIRFSGCFPSLTVLAIEDAIERGVDALNYSIGGSSRDPWQSADSLAFLSARQAGIHVATSAGNSGPDPETVGSPGDSPWLTTVAAYTHDRGFSDKTLSGFTGGDTTAPADITGKAMTDGFTGSIVYAGDYTNANDPDGDPAQCLKPFPAGTFSGQIVVCDRGAIARVDKGRNVKSGGAGALVLANLQDGATSVVADAHVLPAIHINADDGDALRAWLASGTGHTASFTGTEVVKDPTLGKIAAGFTSRGPNKSVPDVIAPSIAAPGVNIFAAYADSQSAGFKENPDPADFAFLSGTSMASPHIAGSLTLIAAIHPSWSPAEVQSALMLTADQNTFKEDGTTASDFFDMGAGFADVTLAAQAGLVMDETFVNYMKANPNVAGKPSALNLPSMANSQCVDTCSWTRKVKATTAASWAVDVNSFNSDVALTVSPTSFELAAGETQELTITADVTNADANWNFGNVILTSNNLPTSKMPIAVKGNGNNFPNDFTILAARDSGSYKITGLKDKQLSNIQVGVYDKSTLIMDPVKLAVPDGDLAYIALQFSETVPNIVFSTSSVTAPDVDLRILDGAFNKIGASAGPTSDESVSFVNLPAGVYYIVVDGYTASAPGATDEVTLNISSIIANAESVSDVVTATVTENSNDFDIAFNWNGNMNTAGVVELSSEDGSFSTQVPFNFVRSENDVVMDVPANLADNSTPLMPGEHNTVTFNIAPNFGSTEKVYTLSAEFPEEHEVANITNDGVVNGHVITWTIHRLADSDASSTVLPVSFDLIPRKSGEDYTLTLTNTLAGDAVSASYNYSVAEVAPVAKIDAPATIAEGYDLSVNGAVSSDANGDNLTYSWTQLSGTSVRLFPTSAALVFKTPSVSKDGEVLSFQLTVSDGNGNSDTTVTSINVVNKNTGGSFGWLIILSAPLLWMRRRISK